MPFVGNAGPLIANQASLQWTDAVADELVLSNTVNIEKADGELEPASLAFYDSEDYSQTSTQQSVGDPLFLQLNASGCDLSSVEVDQVTVSLTTQGAEDSETLILTETGANTGVFRFSRFTTSSPPAVPENGVLEMVVDDRVVADVVSCSAARNITAVVLIDPMGVVYDSLTNQPIEGALVRLVDVTGDGNGGRPGQDAVVYELDGTTPAPSRVITGADGRFEFPLTSPSQYRLEITPPDGYTFPSVYPPSSQPAGREIGVGSYGEAFTVSRDTGAVTLDVPLDKTLFGLVADISVSPNVVGVGELARVTLNGRNLLGADLDTAELRVVIPPGLRVVPESVRIGGVAVPATFDGNELVIDLGAVTDGQLSTLTFYVATSSSTTSADLLGLIQGQLGGTDQQSNLARTTLSVQDSFGQAYLFGKIYTDCNNDRVQGPEEVGVPGVRLYLQNGDWVVTDREGKYSFQALPARLYSLRVDVASLPQGAELSVLSPDFAGDSRSRFVDLRKNELHKANFAIEHCHEAVMQHVHTRREQLGEAGVTLSSLSAASALTASSARLQDQIQRRRATQGGSNVDGDSQTRQTPVRDVQSLPVTAPINSGSPEVAFPQKNAPSFMDLVDGQIVAPGPVVITVKGPLGARLGVLVNDVPVSEKQLAQKQTQASSEVQLLEYRGVQLLEGKNRLELVVLDGFGNQRHSSVIHVTAPGKIASLDLQGDENVVSDGTKPVRYFVALRDENQVEVNAPVAITLDSSVGRWLVKDLNPDQAGIQTALNRDGYQWLPPLDGQYNSLVQPRITARYGSLSDELRVRISPAPRPLFVNGVAELGAYEDNPAATIFHDADKPLSDEGQASARVAFFADGNVSDAWRLKASYDNQKQDDELFRAERAEQFHPIYGDSATRGHDAQSSDDLYLRLDGKGQTLQWGDFSSEFGAEGEQLGAMRDVGTGYRGWHSLGGVALQAYAATTSGDQQSDEIPADGTSGPYGLTTLPIVENSELVEVIERDRNASNNIVARRSLARNVDYRIDPVTAEIFLREPLPSLAPDTLNPVSLLVTYRSQSAGRNGEMFGVGISAPVTKSVGVSAAVHTRKDDVTAANNRDLQSVSVNWKQSKNKDNNSTLEWAQSDANGQSGSAWRWVWQQQLTRDWLIKTRWSNADESFDNIGSGVIAGREEQAVNLHWNSRVGDFELSWLAEDQLGRERNRAELAWQAQWQNWTTKLGIRHQQSTAAGQTVSSEQLVLGLQRQFLANKAQLGVDYIQDLADSGLRYLRVQGEWRPTAGTRLYATHQVTDSLGNDSFFSSTQGQQATQIGVETDWLAGAQAFSEYRIRDAISGNQAETAYGVRNTWRVTNSLRVGARAERVQVLSGDIEGESTAISTALDYQPSAHWKNAAKLEWRDSPRGDRWLWDLASARRINEDWSVTLGYRRLDDRSVLAASEVTQWRAGAAWRPVNNDVWNSLFSVRLREGKGETPLLGSRRALDWHINWQPTDDWVASGFFMHRQHSVQDLGDSFDFDLNAIGGRWRYFLGERWSAGVLLGVGEDSTGLQQQAYGVSLEHVLASNISLAIGYNAQGFEGAGVEDDSLQTGAWLRLRFKFDEDTFGLGARNYD